MQPRIEVACVIAIIDAKTSLIRSKYATYNISCKQANLLALSRSLLETCNLTGAIGALASRQTAPMPRLVDAVSKISLTAAR